MYWALRSASGIFHFHCHVLEQGSRHTHFTEEETVAWGWVRNPPSCTAGAVEAELIFCLSLVLGQNLESNLHPVLHSNAFAEVYKSLS